MSDSIPAEIADQIFDILVSHVGAHESDRRSFVRYEGSDGIEFRFIGTLGFGGKFYNNSSRWYVSCYPEDTSPGREELIRCVNDRLATLRDELGKSLGECQ